MKRTELVRKIRKAAKGTGVGFEMEREGAGHELWVCGGTRVSIPRHTEIAPFTAEGIMKDLESVLGRGWWR